MAIAGEAFADGFGVSTPSAATLHLGGRAERLVTRVGVDDETVRGEVAPAAVAIVRGDGRELARAEVRGGDPAASLDVDVTGVRLLELVTEPVGVDVSHVDWAAARLHVPSLDRR